MKYIIVKYRFQLIIVGSVIIFIIHAADSYQLDMR